MAALPPWTRLPELQVKHNMTEMQVIILMGHACEMDRGAILCVIHTCVQTGRVRNTKRVIRFFRTVAALWNLRVFPCQTGMNDPFPSL